MEPSDAELMRAIADGEKAALGQLYERHIDRVVTFAIGRCRDPHEVADLVSVVWMSVWQSASAFDPSRGEVIGWVIGIASNRFVDLRRKEQRSEALLRRIAGRRLLDEDDIDRISERLDAVRDAGHTGAALSRLPASQRAAFELVALDGMTAEAAASVVGSTPGAVRMRLNRARRSLRREVASQAGLTVTESPEVGK
jgi:RNA polymerase sigma-70 factor (ECF subfamily)